MTSDRDDGPVDHPNVGVGVGIVLGVAVAGLPCAMLRALFRSLNLPIRFLVSASITS